MGRPRSIHTNNAITSINGIRMHNARTVKVKSKMRLPIRLYIVS